jgi:hypothetical protein
MRLVMVMKVRDEIDVVEQTLRYHLARGADQWIVTDNGSTDGTLEVLKRYRDAGLLRLIEEPGQDFRTEAHWWVTRMARLAATEAGADWVAHVDADEFWWPARGSLKETLTAIPEEYGVVLAPRPEFPARPGKGEWWERMTIRERRSRLRPKIAHRADPDVVLHRGAHDVDIEGAEGGSKHAGRAVMRAVKEDADVAADSRLVWAPVFPARVMHFPIRSFEQYKRRVETTLFHGGFDDRAHDDLRRAYDEGRLPELYERLTIDDDEAARAIRERRLIRDTRIRDFLEDCPDPLAGGRADFAFREGTAAEQEAELAEIRHDAMQTLARTQRSLVRQLDNFRERVAKQRKRLKRAEGGPLRRLVRRG